MRSSTGSDIGSVITRISEVEALQSEVREHVEAINDLMSRIARQARGGNGGETPAGNGRRGRRRARPAKADRAVRKGRKARAGKRTPHGALKAAIHQVLAGGKAMKPADVVKALPTAGISKPIYASVYVALRNDSSIKKTPGGFVLKAGRTKEAAAQKSA